MANSDLVTQIIKLATESKKRSTSAYVDQRQDQIMILARQIKPEAIVISNAPTHGVILAPIEVYIDEPIQLSVILFDAQGKEVVGGTPVWTLNPPANAIITQTGLLTPKVEGQLTVNVSVGGITGMGMMAIRTKRGGVANPPSPPDVLAITTQPSSGPSNDVAFSTQPVVRLKDAAGNNLARQNVSVTAAIQSGSGTLGGTTTVLTDANGVATFTNLKITGLIGARTLIFTASAYTSVVSNTITTVAGAASKVAILTQPAGAISGSAFTTQPVVQRQDISGNPILTAGVAVTVAKQTGPGTLSGTTSVNTDANGIATFTNLVITE